MVDVPEVNSRIALRTIQKSEDGGGKSPSVDYPNNSRDGVRSQSADAGDQNTINNGALINSFTVWLLEPLLTAVKPFITRPF